MALDELILRHHGVTQIHSLRHVLHLYEDNNPLYIVKESSFCDSEKLNLLLKCKRNCLGITSTNIQSINAKFNELEAFCF